MKPTPKEISDIQTLHHSLHPENLNSLKSKAATFSQFLTDLNGFQLITYGSPSPHVGRVIVDGVLQQGHDFEKQVRTAVETIKTFAQASTLEGFAALLNSKQLITLLGNFGQQNTKMDLLGTVNYFIALNLNTYDEIRDWFQSEKNRDIFESVGRLGPFFKTADKTADYFRKLLGHWDAVAVDKGQRKLLSDAGVVSYYSKKLSYKEKRTVLQLSALNLGCRPVDLDDSIYQYYVATNKLANIIKSQQLSNTIKYCHSCGLQMPISYRFCTSCGTKQ